MTLLDDMMEVIEPFGWNDALNHVAEKIMKEYMGMNGEGTDVILRKLRDDILKDRKDNGTEQSRRHFD